MATRGYFHPRGLIFGIFNEFDRPLQEMGRNDASSWLRRSCFGDDGKLEVLDNRESIRTTRAFGEVLMPILGQVGLVAGEPAVSAVHLLVQVTREERRLRLWVSETAGLEAPPPM